MKMCVSLMLACAAIALTGCASSTASYAKQTRYTPMRVENDMQYVAAVEIAARRHGVEVKWVHPPQRVVPAEQN